MTFTGGLPGPRSRAWTPRCPVLPLGSSRLLPPKPRGAPCPARSLSVTRRARQSRETPAMPGDEPIARDQPPVVRRGAASARPITAYPRPQAISDRAIAPSPWSVVPSSSQYAALRTCCSLSPTAAEVEGLPRHDLDIARPRLHPPGTPCTETAVAVVDQHPSHAAESAPQQPSALHGPFTPVLPAGDLPRVGSWPSPVAGDDAPTGSRRTHVSKGPHHHHDGHDHDHDHSHTRPAATTPPWTWRSRTSELNPGSSAVGASCAAAGLLGAGIAGASVLCAAHRRSPTRRSTAGRRRDARPAARLLLAGRRPPHPHPAQQRRAVPRGRPGAARVGVRPGLDGDHRPRQRRPRQDRRRQGQPRHRRRPRAVRRRHAGLPGPRVEHPGRRARHGLRPPRAQRGRGAQGVREHLRRRRQRHDGQLAPPTRRRPSRASTSSPRA